MNAKLRKDIKAFLTIYHKFSQIDSKIIDMVVLSGIIDIVDDSGVFWESYKVAVFFPEQGYPNVIPTVLELSEKIERDWDYHISEKGACCLTIPHKLILMKNQGINLIEFYRMVIYPYFANHQYRISAKTYANGEYEHFDEGVIQFYAEEHNLFDEVRIIMMLGVALSNKRILPNKICPICGDGKYKHCCRRIITILKKYGQDRLKSDLELFQSRAKQKLV